MRLLIVESPTKAGKIRGFLGPGWRVEASMGHVRDLPINGGLAVRFDNGQITPRYVPLDKSSRAISALRQAAKHADEIYLATDPDREGEAIAWHIVALLQPTVPIFRVVFQAITKPAVVKAIAQPRSIDQFLVDAQQARRILDRVVGWAVSPTLRRCGKGAKSAGRVQSVVLRLVVDREREIQTFQATDYHLLTATLLGHIPPQFVAKLHQWKGEPIGHRLTDPGLAERTVEWCRKQPWSVHHCEQNERQVMPPPPFTTATAQQAASVALGMAPEATMKELQKLFEAGHITYHRTDSVHLEPEGISAARAVIAKEHPDCLPERPIIHGTKDATAQEAHEAIRPTHPESGRAGVASPLYGLIWTRFICCQMAPGRDAVAIIDAACAPNTWNGGPMGIFRAKGVVRLFDGWRRLGRPAEDERSDPQASNKGQGKSRSSHKTEDNDEASTDPLPHLLPGSSLDLRDLKSTRHTTKPPPRYTEASLIKRMVRDGIGRPSTYAPTLAVLFVRTYIGVEKRLLFATPLGLTVMAFLERAFRSDFIEYDYTARMETALDSIAQGKEPWMPLLTRACRRTVDLALDAGLSRDPLVDSLHET